MAVEAALIVPLLCTLVFGMVEFAFVMRDYASVSAMTRTGDRIASTGADHGPGTCDTSLGAPPCTSASSPALAQEAADAIQRSGAVGTPSLISYILVYKANSAGYPGAEGVTTMPTSCSGVASCVKFTWNDTTKKFRYTSGAWDSVSISACFPGSASKPMDRVGVFMAADHKMMTGFFGTNVALSDRTVMDFEPLATQSCGAGGGTGGHG